jgi:hypothetical protein
MTAIVEWRFTSSSHLTVPRGTTVFVLPLAGQWKYGVGLVPVDESAAAIVRRAS